MSAATVSLVHAKPFESAPAIIAKLKDAGQLSEEEAKAALDKHPGNPANKSATLDKDEKTVVNGPSVVPPKANGKPASNGKPKLTKDEILAKLAKNEIEVDAASKLLSALDRPKGNMYCKVSEKGACSVYGLQRMPVTLYSEQWTRLLDFADAIREFLVEHDSELSKKADKVAA